MLLGEELNESADGHKKMSVQQLLSHCTPHPQRVQRQVKHDVSLIENIDHMANVASSKQYAG